MPSKVIALRLSDEPLRVLQSKVEEAGCKSMREWIERAILENQTVIVAKNRPPPDLIELIYQVNKAGNNINQIAYQINSLRRMDLLDPARYEDALETLSRFERLFSEAIAYARSR